MSDSKRDELTTHDVQTRCAQRVDTNDLAREQRAIRANGTRQGARHTRTSRDNAYEQHARHLRTCRRFETGGVAGPTSKLSPRAPAQMGRRETEHEGGKQRRETGKRGNPRPSCCPAPRSGALAVGGYKRPRRRERGTLRVVPSSRAANLL